MKKTYLFSTLGLAVMLASCGGGGGSSSSSPAPAAAITGTAATGAPISGSMNAVVSIKDSSPLPILKSTKTDASGHYAFTHADIDGMTPPLMEEVDYEVAGTHYYLHSAVTSADLLKSTATINITPFTDLVIANIAGDIARHVFQNNTYKTKLTPSALQAGSTALATILQPVLASMGVSSTVDLFHDSFSADHTGLDKVLDSVKVLADPTTNTVSLTNAASNASVQLDMTKSLTELTSVTLPAPTGTTVTDLQAIQAEFAGFMAVMNGPNPPAANDPKLLDYFDTANFLDDGDNYAAFSQNIVNPAVEGHLAFANITLDPVPAGMLPAALSGFKAYKVNFQVIIGGAPQDVRSFVMYRNASNNWVIVGNQKKARADLRPEEELSYFWQNPVGGGPGSWTMALCTALDFNIKDPGNFMIPGTSTRAALSYAIVTGPGLPADGALYYNNPTGSNELIAAAGAPSTFAGANTTPMNGWGSTSSKCSNSSAYPLTDGNVADIQTAFNTPAGAVYTFKLFVDTGYAAGNTPVVTYQSRLYAVPLPNTALNTTLFPSNVTASPLLEFAAVQSKITYSTLSWTAPAAPSLGASDIWVSVGLKDGGWDSVGPNLLPTDTQVTIAVPNFTGHLQSDISANITLTYYDTAGRKMRYSPPQGTF